MTPDELTLHVAASNGRLQRVVSAVNEDGDELHRGNFDVNSEVARKRFFKAIAKKTGIPVDDLTHTHESRLLEAADHAESRADAAAAERRGDGDGQRPSQATILVNLAEVAEPWHTSEDDAYATIPVDDRKETWPVRSKAFKRWLARRFFLETGKAPGSQAMHDALNVIKGKAVFDGTEEKVFVRVAGHGKNIYLDLCDSPWRAVEITPEGWCMVDKLPVRFRRARAMRPLPVPGRGGAVSDLRRFLNVADDDWPLVISWLVAMIRPTGPYPVLSLHGEQGSAKSTMARVLRLLVDPNAAPLRSEPREPRDLMIAANNSWVIALDNLSRLPAWLSDALCRLSTGGGFSTRTLYENDEETIFDAMRPVILTSIEEVGTRGDLLDRCLLTSLPTIPESRRRHEKEFWRDFDKARPRILGALLDAVSAALAREPYVRLDRLPRMADFALWATAAEEGLGLSRGEFITAYTRNRATGNELALDASPVAKSITDMMDGTATELLATLDERTDEKTKRLKSWPKSP